MLSHVKDTSAPAAAKFQEMIMNRSAQERLSMAFSMFDAARALVLSGIHDKHGNLDSVEVRVQLFLRTYGEDLPRARVERVVHRIRRAATP
jgi:hypothetical protein